MFRYVCGYESYPSDVHHGKQYEWWENIRGLALFIYTPAI